ncbi:uncharacterized protein LOC116345737 [Contarinia nasturtii]|uniref:uncharacterized protein LOC116345737 n=1 Tax=Contarinia nasturtii TaxID=265458 RepID=UPI0012D4061C|nr:uncharacterized protein LOC116345737 [Contarinia nasturtii]
MQRKMKNPANDEISHSDGTLVRSLTTRAQREIFLLEQAQSGVRCSVWFSQLICGPLDLDVLANVLKQLTLKVPLLQTRFAFSDGELWQIHDPSICPTIRTIDVSSSSVPFEEALKRMRESAENRLSLTTGDKLYEFTFYIVDNNTHIVHFLLHHSIIDGRSSAKLVSMITAAYNDLIQGKPIIVRPELHFGAIAGTDAKYQSSPEHQQDEKFWKTYVQSLCRHAYTQRNINPFGNKTTNRCTHTLRASERQKLKQTAASMNVVESILYIGVSALLFRSHLDNECVSLSLPVSGTHMIQELGMTANLLPLLLRIPEHATFKDVLNHVNQETKSILLHQRYRVTEIRRHANYSTNISFGPSVNIMLLNQEETLENCICSNHSGANIDTNEFQITFCTDHSNGHLDIFFDDIEEGHSKEQLIALKDRLIFILDLIVNSPNSTVSALDALDGYHTITSVEEIESFYANRRTPVAAGFLQWGRCVDSLVRLVHSNIWVGSGPSPFATSKILLTDRVVNISKLKRGTIYRPSEAPGTLLVIGKTTWHIAVSDGVVEISEFIDEDGQPISAPTLAKQCHLLEGDKLPIITAEQAEWLSVSRARSMHSESYWNRCLANFEPCTLSIIQNCSTHPPMWVATNFRSLSSGYSATELLVAWLVYIARDRQMSQLQIGWDATESINRYADDNQLATYIFAKTVPFSVSIHLCDTFPAVMASVNKNLKQLINNLPCLSDLHVRHTICSSNNLRSKKPWALAISLINTQNLLSLENTDAHGSFLTLQINKYNGTFRWIYDTNQISDEEVNRISSRMLVLLTSAHSTDQAQMPVGELDLLPKTELELLLNVGNQTDTNYPAKNGIHLSRATVANSKRLCCHEIFEAQVEQNEHAIAVECEEETLSYTELNARANRLAHYLITKGVKPDDLIAVCVKRSTKMLVAILGILKSGGAYVPLDPVYSSQRLINILEDADPLYVLVDATGQKALGHHQVTVVDLDQSLPGGLSPINPDSKKLGLTPAHLAYVIYTSGSTGKPKGVMIEHQQVTRLFEVTRDKFAFNKQDKWCLFHSFSFDVSVWEIWGALSNGSQLAIVPHETGRCADEFYKWVCNHGITVLNQTPSAFKMFMQAKNISSLSDRLRYVIFAGEEFDQSIAKNWHKKYYNAQTELVNMYGTTETTVHATYQLLKASEYIHSIGRPIADLCAYLLDTHGEPVPFGAEGELYIGGAGLARGYLNRPELTAERFVPNPFSENTLARMYRTGDWVRYLPDGNLVYLGRIDQQVKIRGFRIELGEIETHLMEHNLVRDAVVLSWKNKSNTDAQLVAYVVADPDASLVQHLRRYLSALLPDYMVPAAYVCVSSLPLTPNGKLDRCALPPPNDDAFVRQAYEAPQGEIEARFASIWSDLLGIDRISRHDNFFELGGHSLLAIQFANQASKVYNMCVEARGLFSFPILKDLAEKTTSCGSQRLYSDSAIPVRRFGCRPPIFLLPDGTGDTSYAFELAPEIDKSFPVFVLPWPSPEKEQPSCVQEMASTMIPLIKKIQPNGPCAIAGYSAGGILAYEVANQLINSGYSVSFLGLIDTYPPTEVNVFNDLECFLFILASKYPSMRALDDAVWWERVKKLTFNEAIEEIERRCDDFKIPDIEWEVILSKQRTHYQNICTEYEFNSLPITINLFKGTEYIDLAIFSDNKYLDDLLRKFVNNSKEFYNHANLDWKNYHLPSLCIIPIEGDHRTILSDRKSRASLGRKITQAFLSQESIKTT